MLAPFNEFIRIGINTAFLGYAPYHILNAKKLNIIIAIPIKINGISVMALLLKVVK